MKKHKGDFQCLYAPITLIDSIYRNEANYYPIVFLKKYHIIKDRNFL